MALDSQRSRGAQHGGVPISPVLQRSPLPNDPFYRLRNDPRQNTIPVLNGSLMSMDRDFPTIPGGSTTAESHQHRFFNDPRSPTILFTGCATIPVKIPSQCINGSLLSMDRDSPTIPGGPPRRRSDDPGGPSTVESQQHRFLNDPRFPTILFYRLRNDPRQNTIPVLNGSLMSMDLDFQRSRGGHHGGVPSTPVLQRSPLPNDPFYRLRNDPRQNTIPVLNGSLMSMDRDFQRSRGGHHGGVPSNTGSSTIHASQRSLSTGCATIPVKIPSQSSMDP